MATYAQQSYPPPAPCYPSGMHSSTPAKYVPDDYDMPPRAGGGHPNPRGAPAPLTSKRRGPEARAISSGKPAPPIAGTDAFTNGPPRAAKDPMQRHRSHESTRSRRSHDSRHSRESRHSHDSHRSHRNRRSHETDRTNRDDKDRERGKEKRHRHRHRPEDHRSSAKRHDYDDRKPTFGDTVFAVLGGLKNYLGPRERL